MHRLGFVLVVVVACAAGSAVVDACGDKFLMVGRGLAFGRAYASVYPGSIVIYSGPRTMPQHEKLQQTMRRAGHRVVLVEDEAMLSRSLLLEQTDIVIADVLMKTNLDPQIAGLHLKPSVLYLVNERDQKQAAAAPQDDASTIRGAEKAGKFLTVIEDIMKTRHQAGVRIKRG